MKAKVKSLALFIVAFLVAVVTVGYAFAWFFDRKDANFTLTGASAGAYFDATSGDGTTEEQAFVISNATHMRNLAVLQNTGRFVDENGNPKKYYFKIKDDVAAIDMGALWLPPIGNDDHPFIGDFNGKGKTITNLKVTTDKGLLTETNYPTQASADYAFSQAVGLFGNTGTESNIHNFILDNPHVVVGAIGVNNNNYSAGSEKAVGIAVGHVAGKCSSIGVLATDAGASSGDGEGSTSLDVRVTGYSTFNSILGELGEGVESSVTGGGHTAGTGGSGANFGANFDVEGMYDRLKKIEANKNSTPAWRLPNLGDSSKESITIASLDKLPFAVDSTSTYEGADAREVIANNNIGYLLGNQNKVYNKDLNFGDLLIEGAQGNWTYSDGKTPADGSFPRWIYKTTATEIGGDYYSTGNGFAPLTQEEFDALPEGIQELVPTASGTVTGFNSIRLSQTYQNAAVQIYSGSDSNGQWSPHGQISWMGKTYGEGLTKTNYKGDAVDEDELQFTAEGYKIDENGLMFSADGYFVNTEWPLPSNVDEEGYLVDGDGNRSIDINGDEIKYGGYKLGSDADEYYLIKEDGTALTLDMGWGSTKRVTPKTGTPIMLYSYKNGIALPNCGIWFKPAQSGKIRFVMYAETSGDGFALIKGHRTNATKENPFIVDYDKNGSDITITEVGKYKIPKNVLFYFEFDVSEEDIEDGRYEYWLMQYGSGGAYFVYLDMGASAAEDTSGVVPDTVSAVDFIYEGVEIEQEDATIGIGNFIVNTSATKALYESSKTSVYFDGITTALKVVYVRLHNDDKQGHSGKTICLEYTATDDLNEVAATYAAYVCPTIKGGSGTVSGGGTGGGTETPDPTPTTPTVTGVTVSGAPTTAIIVGGTVNLTANVTMSDGSAYSGNVVWTSSDENVATVANGVVTAKAAGTATITVTTADGNFTASCNVTVEAATEAVTIGVDFKEIFDATSGTTDSSGRKDIAQVNHKDRFAFNGGKIGESFFNNQTNSFTVTLNGTADNSIVLEGTGASSGATVSIVIKDSSGKEVGRSTQQAASGSAVTLTVNNLAKGAYTVSVVKTNETSEVAGSVRFTRIEITENYYGEIPVEPTVENVSLDKTVLTLSKDETATLTATVTMSDNSSNSNVTWSSNSDLVTVDENGNIKVIGAPASDTEVIITATAGAKSATCTVTVLAANTATSWSLDYSGANKVSTTETLSAGTMLAEGFTVTKVSSTKLHNGGYLTTQTGSVFTLEVYGDAIFSLQHNGTQSARTYVIKDINGNVIDTNGNIIDGGTVSGSMSATETSFNISKGTYTIEFTGEHKITKLSLTYK